MKILVIRLSSMGDIIYTTPIVRCLKKQLPDAEIHFLTKPTFQHLYDNNPYLDKLLLLKPSLNETIKEIKQEQYDYLVDLHKNIRTRIIKFKTGIPSSTYSKQTLLKWLSLKLKKNLVPPVHLVDRYFKAVRSLGVINDQQPIDYFFREEHQLNTMLPPSFSRGYIAFVIGATHFTKRMPNAKVISICNQLQYPIVLLGGKDVAHNAQEIQEKSTGQIFNACGSTNLDASVFLVSQAISVIGFDTGLTHIAEAFNKPIVSIWGSTIPELLGVQPYQVDQVLEMGVDLPCRPCSKFGLPKCPKGHFKCMWEIPEKPIVTFITNAIHHSPK
ncbi:glycosyltransferase family 9 protein [Olivibacter ginsenosidimutans]|uniref:Glycosyltransferase family 9 protein n=1 Tax=Olivibacter ginsenosidimutans TaxID=1176537 RepID=A0ABP9BIS8_9SPHI